MQDVAGDLFATKGLEYVLVIGYLTLLVLCWRFVRPLRAARAAEDEAESVARRFGIPDGYHFHPAHTWVRPGDGAVLRVGMDAFAHRLLGPITELELPEVGTALTAGEPGWYAYVDGKRIPILAPVDGEVVARNEAVARSAEALRADPYDEGWLVEVRVPDPAPARRNLLSGRVARAWRDEVVNQLLELADQNGGQPALDSDLGLAKALDPEDWAAVVRAFLKTDGATRDGARVPGKAEAEHARIE